MDTFNITSEIINKYDKNKTRLMDILLDLQEKIDFIDKSSINHIAEELNISSAEVEQTLSFYHFFKNAPRGRYSIFLNNSVVANMFGRKEIAKCLEKETGAEFGSVSPDGLFGLYDTPCIGMNDQEPAAIINGRVFTRLTCDRVKRIINHVKSGKHIDDLLEEYEVEGKNKSELIKGSVVNNIRKKGKIIFSDYKTGDVLKKVTGMKSDDIIKTLKEADIRGRGGAGFPTGLKWDLCRKAEGSKKYIFCNADEGEPGTFKDRVILTEHPELLFEGMAIAGYTVGAEEGILYIRYEYKYMEDYLNKVLDDLRKNNYLGKDIAGEKGFNFDIRLQFGAGSYVCGEESALIESAEGKRGEPRDRPPFPTDSGYLGYPTVINNVETLCNVVKILEKSAEWYKSLGVECSTGTKVLSISGDCESPGIYEVEWGFSVNDLLDLVGADKKNIQAVQVGGPSGCCIGPDGFNRTLCYSDLSTGGSLIIIGKQRDLLKDVVMNFTDFFIEESCGSCTPCRSLTVILRDTLAKILAGRGVQQDVENMLKWSQIMQANRCGLGKTATNPIVSSIENFRHLYDGRIQKGKDFDTGFDLKEAMKEASIKTHRKSNLVQG